VRVAIICGTREYLTPKQQLLVKEYVRDLNLLIVGDATGVDDAALTAASNLDIPYDCYKADWSRGPKGGPERNIRMAEYLLFLKEKGYDARVIAFPGGKGTASMKREAKKRGLPVFEVGWSHEG
jgi:hypothetical protein